MIVENKKVPQFVLPRGLLGRITFFFMNRGHKSIYENVANLLELRPEDDLLEIGCGNGYFLKKYAPHVNNIAGLDLSELSVKLATRKNKDRVTAGTAKFTQGDASQLPWEDNKFSVATAMASFAGFPKPLESLKEMYRVLRPGGRAVISIEWNAEDGKDHTNEIRKYGYQIWSEDEVNNMFKGAGFSDVTFSYAKGMMMPKMMIARGVKQ
jgi:ubiquinone/menaquinone biosynthesis C-methylase UbiE